MEEAGSKRPLIPATAVEEGEKTVVPDSDDDPDDEEGGKDGEEEGEGEQEKEGSDSDSESGRDFSGSLTDS